MASLEEVGCYIMRSVNVLTIVAEQCDPSPHCDLYQERGREMERVRERGRASDVVYGDHRTVRWPVMLLSDRYITHMEQVRTTGSDYEMYQSPTHWTALALLSSGSGR